MIFFVEKDGGKSILNNKVKVWQEQVKIPTYPVGKPDKNPMFLEKRVYQGSSGKVYPHTVIDKIYDEKTEKEYTAVFLENDYIKVMILPEIGGRIQRATDKTNQYDFVYYNHVVKPALVGLAGPWISGGIEFNWPQHHRPSTFDPVDYTYYENEDGSATVVVSEIENMFRTKGMAKISLYPDSSYIEIKAQLYNRTDTEQTFLWWANPAVAVNDNTRSIFPPDVTAVMDHGKRAVSTFPIATGTYYKVDYSAGVDISRYKNLPVPTSYMAAKSDYDFVGGYDDKLEAGILHVADHHVSPGKKQWTWGCGDFGKAWDRNLTDSDGPYVELMTGCFTDNQPDFTWLAPLEEKQFTQYFMPYKKLGTVHNATKDLAMNCENGAVHLYATGNVGAVTVYVYDSSKCVLKRDEELHTTDFVTIEVPESTEKIVIQRNGLDYLKYEINCKKQEVPDAATAPPAPKDCETTEDLYLYGLHIEQYRHATYLPEDYYLEGLRRDATDIRLNNAYGKLLFKRGKFEESEKYFRNAIKKATRSNPNPYDSEPYYNLGLSLLYQNRLAESYDAFYKSMWSNACCESAFYHMACLCAVKKDYQAALEHAERSILKNAHNIKALDLKALLLEKTGEKEAALEIARGVLKIDPLDVISRRVLGEKPQVNYNTAIEIACEYAAAGFIEDAALILEEDESGYPLISYYLSFYYSLLGNSAKADAYQKAGRDTEFTGCFPHRLTDLKVLEHTLSAHKEDWRANYYLGCLLYDKKRYDEAIECWERSVEGNDGFPTSHRNLALAYYNKKNDPMRAQEELEKAFSLDNTDARVLMELDQLYKKNGKTSGERLALLNEHMELVEFRDDLLTEYITLLNTTGRYEDAYSCMMSHNFHPWEGGEGKITAQYVFSLTAMAKQEIENGNCKRAVEMLSKTAEYPHNLGQGKLYGAQENLQNYLLGFAYEKLGDNEKATACYEKAAAGLSEPKSAMYYNDQPPETIFCQGIALLKLGREKDANERFDKLIKYADAHIDDDVKIDYFAVSLPDFLVFDEDLNKKNRVHCLFMKALGLLGKNEKERADETLNSAYALEKYHFGMNSYKTLFMNEGE